MKELLAQFVKCAPKEWGAGAEDEQSSDTPWMCGWFKPEGHRYYLHIDIRNDLVSAEAIVFLWDWLEGAGCVHSSVDNLGFNNETEAKWRVHGGFGEGNGASFYVDGATRIEALVRAVVAVRSKP